MTETIAASLIAALGALGTALVSVLGSRNRLRRIEAISAVLKDLPVHNEAYELLAAVRLEDVRELRKSQQSTFGFFIATSVVGLALSVALSTYGEEISAWSPTVYLLLLVAYLVTVLLLVTFYIAVIAGYLMRLIRAVRGWLSDRGHGGIPLRDRFSRKTGRRPQPS